MLHATPALVMVVLCVLLVVSLLLVASTVAAQRRQLSLAPPPAALLPPVSVLKPLKGVDPGLQGNLEAFFRLDYPVYEIVFAVERADEPAAEVAREVAAANRSVRSRLVVSDEPVGLNPKVNNLAAALRQARHQLLLVADSNVRPDPGLLRDLVAHLQVPGTGLVSAPVRGSEGSGLGGALDALHLNTFVMCGTAALHQLGAVCVTGKAMMLRRSVLDDIGGLAELGRFLAEDQVCGEEVARRGLAVRLSSRPVDDHVGRQGIGWFVARHLRWARIRRRLSPVGFLAEPLLFPGWLAIAAAMSAPRPSVLLLALGAVLVRAALDAVAERRLGVHRPLAVYPGLSLLRDLVVIAAWPVALVSREVGWRGHSLRLGRRTLLQGDRPDAAPPAAEAARSSARP